LALVFVVTGSRIVVTCARSELAARSFLLFVVRYPVQRYRALMLQHRRNALRVSLPVILSLGLLSQLKNGSKPAHSDDPAGSTNT
jgi:hypothetical protein